jgi:hypothetical protein
MLKRFTTSLLVIVVILALVGAAFVLYGREESWEAL